MSKKFEAPPEGLNHDDLAVPLLQKMGVGWTMANALAASEALKLKASQPDWSVSRAYVHILDMWSSYKASEQYRSPYRRKAASWLTEADWDNPQIWGGKPILAYQEKPKPMTEVEMWRRDKELHPENYATPEETKEFWAKFKEIAAKGWRMPQNETPSMLRQKDATDCSTVGSREKPLPKNNGPQQ